MVGFAGRVGGGWAAGGFAGVLLPARVPRARAGGLRRVRLFLSAARVSGSVAAGRAYPALGSVPVRRGAVPGQSANGGVVSAVVAGFPPTGAGPVPSPAGPAR